MAVISIDKLSVTGRLDEFGQSSMTEFLSSSPYEVEYRSQSWNFMYQHQWLFKHCGIFIQIGKYEQEHVFRIEFNPNKIEKEYLTFYFNIIKRVKYPNVTRIDWAIDYQKDFTKYDIRQTTSRKTIEYKSRKGELETLYIGSPKSDNFTRVYNKALEKKVSKRTLMTEWDEQPEIKMDEILWRVEAVVKDFTIDIEKEVTSFVEHENGSYEYEYTPKWYITGKDHTGRQIVKEYDLKPVKRRIDGAVKVKKQEKVGYDYIFQNPFENIEIYMKDEGEMTDLKTSEKAMLFYLLHHPEAWEELSPNSRKKYEKLTYANDWVLIDNQPKEVFEKEKSRLAQELESWLKPALDKSNFLTGYKSNVYFSLEFMKQQ